MKTNNFELLRFLVNQVKVDIKRLKDKNNVSAMHVAAEYGNDLMIYMIGEMGGDVNAVDHMGNTPLHIATLNTREHSVNFLLSMRAEVNIPNMKGQSALHNSVLAKNLRSCKDLLIKGANRG